MDHFKMDLPEKLWKEFLWVPLLDIQAYLGYCHCVITPSNCGLYGSGEFCADRNRRVFGMLFDRFPVIWSWSWDLAFRYYFPSSMIDHEPIFHTQYVFYWLNRGALDKYWSLKGDGIRESYLLKPTLFFLALYLLSKILLWKDLVVLINTPDHFDESGLNTTNGA
jgi:hypothetical protein